MRLLIAGILSLVIYLLSCACGNEEKEIPQGDAFPSEEQQFPYTSPHGAVTNSFTYHFIHDLMYRHPCPIFRSVPLNFIQGSKTKR